MRDFNGTVRKAQHFFRHAVGRRRILTMRHAGVHINQQRVNQLDGVVVLLLALHGRAVETDLTLWQLLARDQRVEQQR